MSVIKCKECGKEIPENAKTCPNCGCPVPSVEVVNVTKTAKKERDPNSFNVLGIISGIISVLGGFIVLILDTGYHESSYTYGGDAYTGIQNASAQAANNINALATIAKFGFAFLLIAVGLALIAYFFKCKVKEDKLAAEKAEAKPETV